MPRKKQAVQKQRRRKAYNPVGDADAVHVKKRGAFAIFSNYKLFAAIGVTALAGGLILTTVLGSGAATTVDGDLGVRGEGVIRTTPEPGATPDVNAPAPIKQYSAPPAMVIDESETYRATIRTEKGDVVIELDASLAPQAVNNFIFLANDGFYDGQTFFRVVADDDGLIHFAQAGDPTGTGSGGPGYTLPFEDTDAPFEPGTLAVARPQEAGAPNNGSQFFFTLQSEPTLEGKFTTFGRVVEGLDVLESLTVRNPQTQQNPEPGVRIESVEVSQS